MAKFILLATLIPALFAIVSLTKYQKLPVDNTPFDFAKFKDAHEQKMELLTELERKKHMGGVEEKVEEKKVEFVLVLETEEEKRGQEVYQKRCVVCHGKNAEGKKSQNAPKLAGQFEWYTIKQLNDMKAKRRVNAVMDPYLKPLNEKDFKDIAAYLAKYPWHM